MKDILKKILHIIIYILAVWGVISGISFGVGSCSLKNNAPQQSNSEKLSRHQLVYGNENYSKSIILKDSFTTVFYHQHDDVQNLDLVEFTPNARTLVGYQSYSVRVYLDDSMVFYNNEHLNDAYDTLSIIFWWDSSWGTMTLSYMYLEGVNLPRLYIYNNGVSEQKTTILFNNLDFSDSLIRPLPNESFDYVDFIKIFFNYYDNQNIDFTFDPLTMNPITYLSYEILGENVAHNTGSWTASMDLNLVFVSNGMTFKKLRFQYDYVLGSYYDNVLTTYNDMTYLALSYISYQDYFTDEWVKVCYPRIYKYETRTLNNVSSLEAYPFTDFNTYLWTNEGYKSITILDGAFNIYSTLSGDPVANLTNIQILTYQGEYNRNVYLNGNNDTNVFNLISYGFSSVMPLFAITLLPGLTIGTLLFLPLVVVIIFAIIKLLRK